VCSLRAASVGSTVVDVLNHVQRLLADLEVDNEEDEAKHDADGTHDEISDAKKWVLPSEPRGSRQRHLLLPVKRCHWKSIVNTEGVVAGRQALVISSIFFMINASVQLAEVRQSSRPHPHDQVLILIAIVLCTAIVQLVHVLMPGRRHDGPRKRPRWVVFKATGVLEFDTFVRVPGEVSLQQGNGHVVMKNCQSIIEEAVSDGPARSIA